jgi:ADP-ribose pyrophosphatase YjhB (NUDIX family)
MDKEIEKKFGGKVRVRVCGLCWQQEQLLMVNHQGLYPHDFWSPPGGGVEFGESATDALIREFAEETGLAVTTERLAFVCELVKPPLHAIELFFEVKLVSGTLRTGTDPELSAHGQMIKEVRLMPESVRKSLPAEACHRLIGHLDNEKIRRLNGYFRI